MLMLLLMTMNNMCEVVGTEFQRKRSTTMTYSCVVLVVGVLATVTTATDDGDGRSTNQSR